MPNYIAQIDAKRNYEERPESVLHGLKSPVL